VKLPRWSRAALALAPCGRRVLRRSPRSPALQAVACTSRQPGYTLKPADLVVGTLDELSMMSIRALFTDSSPGEVDPPYLERVPRPSVDFWGNELGTARARVLDREQPPGGGGGAGGDIR